MSYLFTFSNTTHLKTALPLIESLKAQNIRIGALFDFTNSKYSSGLKKIQAKHADLFDWSIDTKIPSSLPKRLIYYTGLKSKLKDLCLKNKVSGHIAFTEGGTIEWFTIGCLKRLKIKNFCLQWAITWKPEVYIKLKKDLPTQKQKPLSQFIKSILGINYSGMKFLGDGEADYLLCMGDFWKEQFSAAHPTQSHKFFTTGNPRFKRSQKNKKQNSILLATGAGTGLYSYSREKHLSDIKEIYQAWGQAQLDNYEFIHKVHPRDPYLQDIKGLSQEFKNIQVTAMTPIENLLCKSKVTITIRSTVGLEALIAHNSLVIYNNGHQDIPFNFAHENLASEAQTPEELCKTLKDISNISFPKNFEHYVKLANNTEDTLRFIKDHE